MKRMLGIVIFSLLSPFFLASCNQPKPITPPYKGDVSLLTYDTMTVDYTLPKIDDFDKTKLNLVSSDSTLFVIKDQSYMNKVVIESNLNNKVGVGDINFIYDDVLLENKISVAVNYPTNLDEAFNAVTLAAIKLPAGKEFKVTFNFANSMEINDFDLSLEIYGRRGIIDYQHYGKGTSVENEFAVSKNQSYATISSRMREGDENYHYNLHSLNYLSRSIYDNETNNTYYIDTVEKTLEVNNSDELFWSVEHGYRPIIPDNLSGLKAIYNSAKTKYCSKIADNWSDLVKFRELFDMLIDTTYYDNDPNLESGYWWEHKAYFLEGVFADGGKAVCDGFSKTYALICGILGLPCFRSFGIVTGETTGHAWNYVNLDNNWYLVCPTWAKIGISSNPDKEDYNDVAKEFGKNLCLPSYSAFLASKNYFRNQGVNYSDLAFPSIVRSSTQYSKNIDEINYFVTCDDDAKKIHDKVVGKAEDMTCICFKTRDTASDVEIERWFKIICGGTSNDLTAYLTGFYFEDYIEFFACIKG